MYQGKLLITNDWISLRITITLSMYDKCEICTLKNGVIGVVVTVWQSSPSFSDLNKGTLLSDIEIFHKPGSYRLHTH